jgi:RNA-binding protein YhbY
LPTVRSCARRAALCSVTATGLNSLEQSEDPSEGSLGPQVYVTHMEDALWCGETRVDFLRAAFGTHDDVMATPILRAEPFQADAPLRNCEALRGKIALVQRGSSSGAACSFVEKALRVQGAGAVAMVLVNTEDSMISPGDSAREGAAVTIPVVGIRSSNLSMLSSAECVQEGSDAGCVMASLTFKPVAPLRPAARKHLRALASHWKRGGSLCELPLDESANSESVLSSVDALLEEEELVLLRMAGDDGDTSVVCLQTLEDMVDVATVIADNLGATCVHITHKTILLFRQRSPASASAISLPVEGEESELDMDLGELASSISMLGQFEDWGEESDEVSLTPELNEPC